MSRYAIETMLNEERMLLDMTYNLDVPPPRPPEIYTNIENGKTLV
jgi:hypothetical protein